MTKKNDEDNPAKLLDNPRINLAKGVKESIEMTVVVAIYVGLVTGFTISFLPGYLKALNPQISNVKSAQSFFTAFQSLGAIIGCIMFGYSCTKYSIKLLIVCSNFISVISICLFGYVNLLPRKLRFPWAVFLSFCMGLSLGVIALIRTYASLLITSTEVRVKFLTYISAIGGLGSMISSGLIWLASHLGVSKSYSSHYPIFDSYTSVIFTVSILGLVIAFLAYYTVLDLNEAKEIQNKHLSEIKTAEGGNIKSSDERDIENQEKSSEKLAEGPDRKKALKRVLTRPEIKTSYADSITYVSWFGALTMSFIWFLGILIMPLPNLSNVYSAEFNYTSTKAIEAANAHIMYGSPLGIIGLILGIGLSKEIEPHFLLLIAFILNFFNYIFVLPVFGSEYLVQQDSSLEYGCIYSWCDSEKALREWQLITWGIFYSFFTAFTWVTVTAAHGVAVSIQGQHALHQTIFSASGFFGTLLNPIFVLNVFSFAGMLWLTSIEMAFFALTVILLLVYLCIYDQIEVKVDEKKEKFNEVLPVNEVEQRGDNDPQLSVHQF